MSEPMLQLDGLVRHFDGVRAVDDVSFSVERGTGARLHRSERRRQDDDDADPGDAGYAAARRCAHRRLLGGGRPEEGPPDHRLHARLRRRLREHDGRPSISTSSRAPTTCAATRGGGRSRTSSTSWASATYAIATSRACRRASSSASRSAAPSFTIPQLLDPRRARRQPRSARAHRVPHADPRAGRRRQDDPPQLAHPDRARRDVRRRRGDREGPDPGDRHGAGHPRGRAPRRILSVRLAGANRRRRAVPARAARRA